MPVSSAQATWCLFISALIPAIHAWVPAARRQPTTKASAAPADEVPAPISIAVLKGGSVPVQNLPTGYVRSLPHAVLVLDAASGRPALEMVPSDGDGNGWVNPASFHQLWVPTKMFPVPKMRLALGALIKDGQLRCVFPALDSFAVGGGDNGGGTAWRNWGLNSVPLAQTWLDAGLIPFGELSISLYFQALSRREDGEEGSAEATQEESGDSAAASGASSSSSSPAVPAEWTAVHESIDVGMATQVIFEILADPPTNFPMGFMLLTVPLPDLEVPLPSDGTHVRAYLSDYPEPSKLTELAGEASGAGFLEFKASSIASGADSQYLPAAYKPLFKPAGAAGAEANSAGEL